MPRNPEVAVRASIRQLAAHLGDARDQRFEIVLADPPWRYAYSRSKKKAVERHYPTLTIEQIARMPVESLVARNALLFLWATPPLLDHGVRVVNAWGFQYVTCAVWGKVLLGPGYHFRQQHELLLVGKRGKPGTPGNRNIRSVIRSRRGQA